MTSARAAMRRNAPRPSPAFPPLSTPLSAPLPTPQARFQHGRTLAAAAKWSEAARAFEAVARELPADPVPWVNLAHACMQMRDFEEGARAARRAVALDTSSVTALGLAAQCLESSGRLAELVELFASVDMGRIVDADLHVRHGIALTRLGQFEGAVKALLDALRRDMRSTAAFAQLGNVFQLMKMPEEARECFRNALALGRAPVEMATAILFTSLEACSWAQLATDLAGLDEKVRRGEGQPNPFYCLNFSWARHRQLAAIRDHAARLFAGITPLPPSPRRPAASPIRVGFVSSDFHEHATAYLITELFEQYDRRDFRFYAYSYGIDDGSPMRQRIERAFGENFVEARETVSEALARRIREDAIDVLIDLKGYTLFSRSDVFGYRAAPIQVNFLGFPGSLGSDHYDYIIGDPVVSPLDHADGYAEKIAQMPHCYQPNDRKRPIATTADRATCGLPIDGFVFCCLNASYKITPQVFDRWCSLLRRVDDSVLWLFVVNAQARQNLLAEAQRRGISPERIVFAAPVPPAEHLGRMRNADLFLDTAPVNAHTTASDALWAGLPVLTMRGESFVSRVAESLLRAANLPQLIAANLDEYEEIAFTLANDRRRMHAIRMQLLASIESCPLFDSVGFTRDFSNLIRRMVKRYDEGLKPDHLAAQSDDVARATL